MTHRWQARPTAVAAGIGLALGLQGAGALAALVSHTDLGSFQSALRGVTAGQDFDALTPGVVSGTDLPLSVPGGGDVATVTMPSSIPDPFGGADFDIAVVANDASDSNPTRSLLNSLGSTDAGNFNTFVAGTEVGFSFSRSLTGFGGWVVTPDALLDGDVSLHAGAATASLSVADRAALGSFGGLDYFGYFLGITSDGVATDLLQVEFRSPVEVTGAFLYNLDDLIGGVDPLAQKVAPGVAVVFDPSVQDQYLGEHLALDFSTLPPGQQPGPVDFSGNGFSVEISAEQGGTGSALVVPDGGGLTTANAGDTLAASFDGAAVSNVGGALELRDGNGDPVGGEVDVVIEAIVSGNLREEIIRIVFDPTTGIEGTGSFFGGGFLEPGAAFGGSPFEVVGYRLQPVDGTQYLWIDQPVMGAFSDPNAVPSPAALALLLPGLGALAWIRERRLSAVSIRPLAVRRSTSACTAARSRSRRRASINVCMSGPSEVNIAFEIRE